MKKILITGFKPFLSAKVNPTEAMVRSWHDLSLGGIKVEGKVLDVSFSEVKRFVGLLDFSNYIAWIMLGLASDRKSISVEMNARNFVHCDKGPDNEGIRLLNDFVCKEGPETYRSTLPVNQIIKSLNSEGFLASTSQDAGSFVCNYLFYLGVSNQQNKIPSGFIHVPESTEPSHQLAQALLNPLITP